MTQRSALWVFGALILCIACGLAWKWTEPMPETGETTATPQNVPLPSTQEPIVVTNEKGTFTLSTVLDQQTDSVRGISTAVNQATGEKTVLGILFQQGDEIVLARGDATLAATFNRAAEGIAATSVTFTDDSDTRITVAGSWQRPTITFDLAEMFQQDKQMIFFLDQEDGTKAHYQYDPSAKERLSLIP